MSRADFQTITKVSQILDGVKILSELVGEDPKIVLSDEALAKWRELEKLHDDFYKMSLSERIQYSEINK